MKAINYFCTIGGFLLSIWCLWKSYVLNEDITPAATIQWEIIWIIMAAIFGYLSLFYWLNNRKSKKVIAAHHYLINVFEDINTFKSKGGNHQKNCENLSKICQQFAASMRKFHRHDISFSISLINSPQDKKPHLLLYSRNLESLKQRSSRPKGHSEKDYIDENTDFITIFEKIKKCPIEKCYFFCNNLPFKLFYKNTHFPQHWNKRYNWFVIGYFIRMVKWCLPYKSTIVVPIKSGDALLGFLCCDSEHTFEFSKLHDLPIMFVFAELLSSPLERISKDVIKEE